MPARALANLPARNLSESRNSLADRKLRLVRQAIETSGWKFEAVAEEMGLPGYDLSKLLSGEKKFTAEHWELLPDVIETILAKLYAEAQGHAIVQPLPPHEAIGQMLVSLGHALATGQITTLPIKAGPPVKAGLK